jgi:FtsH-binding integral membrane protein
MYVSVIKKAHDAVEGVAYEAALALAAVMLGCAALLFAAGGLALWLATLMPLYGALFVAALLIVFIPTMALYIRRLDPPKKEEKTDATARDQSLPSMAYSLLSLAGPMDVMASGLFARQFKKAPVSTVAATAAVGVVLGIIASADTDD